MFIKNTSPTECAQCHHEKLISNKMPYSKLFILMILLIASCNKKKRYAVTTSNPINIKATSATFVGTFLNPNDKITEKGFCYHPDRIPVYNDNNITLENGTRDDYEIEVKNLKANTSYYIRAYSKLNDGTLLYGNIVQFSTNNEYVLGDKGPAGGIIFYINSFAGKKYFEAIGTQGTKKEFGCLIQSVNTSRLLGEGINNTIALFQNCGNNTAAGFCENLVLNGYNDWCLPTISDLSALYEYYYDNNISFSDKTFWSSSDYGNSTFVTHAFTLDFSNGTEVGILKSENLDIIAIRYFN